MGKQRKHRIRNRETTLKEQPPEVTYTVQDLKRHLEARNAEKKASA